MADERKQPRIQLNMKNITRDDKAEKKTLQGLKKFMKLTAGLLLVLCLIAGGFFLGVYLRVFDVNAVNENLGLYQYPVIGQYFPKPPEKNDGADPVEGEDVVAESKAAGERKANSLTQNGAAIVPSAPVVLTKEEVEKQMKIRQAEEKKRVSKLARLYGEMKPKDAVAIMDDLSDDIVIEILGRMDESQVSKILAEFDPSKSARFTRVMYNGKPPTAQVQ